MNYKKRFVARMPFLQDSILMGVSFCLDSDETQPTTEFCDQCFDRVIKEVLMNKE